MALPILLLLGPALLLLAQGSGNREQKEKARKFKEMFDKVAAIMNDDNNLDHRYSVQIPAANALLSKAQGQCERRELEGAIMTVEEVVDMLPHILKHAACVKYGIRF